MSTGEKSHLDLVLLTISIGVIKEGFVNSKLVGIPSDEIMHYARSNTYNVNVCLYDLGIGLRAAIMGQGPGPLWDLLGHYGSVIIGLLHPSYTVGLYGHKG